MGYRLRSRLSACVIADQAIFLDIERDRYFSVGGGAVLTIKALIAGETPPSDGAAKLLKAGLLQEAPDDNSSAIAISMPTRSLVEETDAASFPGVRATIEVAMGLRRANRALRQRSLQSILKELGERRARVCEGASDQDAKCLDVARTFLAARRLAPAAPRCLPDSLALLDLLARRRLRAELVFGVKLNPFSAHCWVQVGLVALNDALDNVALHTPILAL